MCGIAGIVGSDRPDRSLIERMLDTLDHRGPDQRGYYIGPQAALGGTRLSIVDIGGGVQPIENESRSILIVMNGEIYNYPELAAELKKKGHRFRTRCDTEVALHLFEEHGTDFVHRLNGQFAIAIWDKSARRFLLVRDRPGIRPLFYHCDGKRLLFASEIKALFEDRTLTRELNPEGIDQVFTFWTMIGDTTCFRDIHQLPPGCYLEFHEGIPVTRRYWDYPLTASCEPTDDGHDESWYVEAVREKLAEAVRLRLRADVPVGSYLSGGIDSSAVALLAQQTTTTRLKTFSVEFTDDVLDESSYQRTVAAHLDTEHRSVRCDFTDVGKVFPEVVRHAEQPVFRTAPAPLYLLSGLVRDGNIKVVLTGEGSDEVLWGYDLFKETNIRRFWSRHPSSTLRPQLFRRLYTHHPAYRNPRYFNMLIDFYRYGLAETANVYYSHLNRWRNSISQKSYYSGEFRGCLDGYDAIDHLGRLLPESYPTLGTNEKTQYLECHTLLAGYLLSSQGDRMSMAHSVEGRYPFLDHEFVEFCARVPARYKLRVLRDKYALRKAFEQALPRHIAHRPKHAYQAPEIRSFVCGGRLLDYAAEVLRPERIRESGIFDPTKVSKLVTKALHHSLDRTGTRNNLAFVQILSTQLLHDLFIKEGSSARPPRNHRYEVIIEERPRS